MRYIIVAAAISCLIRSMPTAAAPSSPDCRALSLPPTPELAISERLADRRYVAIGTRAYSVGTENGRFPAIGWHTRGEMGGIWTPPIKLLDGLWFAIDDHWIGPATRFFSGYGYVRMELPDSSGLQVTRTEFAPDGLRAVLVGLTFRADRPRRFALKLDAHSELMQIYPWGWTIPNPLAYNLPDHAMFDGRSLVFRENGRPPVDNAATHDWAAVVGSTLSPRRHYTGENFRGPQSQPVICPPSDPGTPDPPRRCDDTAYGKGVGGRLVYDIDVPGSSECTVWFAVGGSDEGPAAAYGEYSAALADPRSALQRKVAERLVLSRNTRLHLPADPLLAEGIDWSKQNLADMVQDVRDLRLRPVDQGRAYPSPVGRLARARFVGAGWPDYPWLFATDGEYTAFASVAVGQFEAIKDHLRGLRDASRKINGDSGKVVHEVITDGSVYFGTLADPGNTDETAKFPSAVALVWRWTGDQRFLDEMYDFTRANMHYIARALDADHDLWPEGLGNVERSGMGEEKLDSAVYTIRGLRDLATLARARRDTATALWAEARASGMEARFDSAWWMPKVPQHADSLGNPDNRKLQQRHWIGVTPLEVELDHSGEPILGLTTAPRGNDALRLRETPCYAGAFGLFHTGAPGCDPVQSTAPAERKTFTLNTAVMAVAEGNYGRLGKGGQQRFTTGNRSLQLPDPDEQPGAMPEIAPSPDYGRSIDLPLHDRAMVLQAWGAYGTVWSVVHQQLGVRPDLGNYRVEVTPQVPPGSPGIAGDNIRLGDGSLAVSAHTSRGMYVTVVHLDVPANLTIGHTIPLVGAVTKVTLNGQEVPYRVRFTNRGREILIPVGRAVHSQLIVHTAGT